MNEELVICISIIAFFSALCSILRKLVLYYFYEEADTLHTLLYTVFSLYAVYCKCLRIYIELLINDYLLNISTSVFNIAKILLILFRSSNNYFIDSITFLNKYLKELRASFITLSIDYNHPFYKMDFIPILPFYNAFWGGCAIKILSYNRKYTLTLYNYVS